MNKSNLTFMRSTTWRLLQTRHNPIVANSLIHRHHPSSTTLLSRNQISSFVSHSKDTHHSACPCCVGNNSLQHRLFTSKNQDVAQLPTTEIVQTDNEDDDNLATTSSSSFTDVPGAQAGGKKLAIIFTCTVCNTRSAKQFTEHAYQNGVVLVQCPGCSNKHLIADNLGVFTESDSEGWNIESAMKELGQSVTSVKGEDVLELTIDDIVGDDLMQAARHSVRDDGDSNTNDSTTRSN